MKDSRKNSYVEFVGMTRVRRGTTIDDDTAANCSSKPTFKSNSMIDGLQLVETYNKEIDMDEPIYVELSKLCMTECRYNVIQKTLSQEKKNIQRKR